MDVEVRKNARARRLQFRLDPRKGHVRLTLPPGVSLARGLAFVQSRADWITPRRTKILSALTLDGIPIDGRVVPIVTGAKASIGEEQITLPEGDQAAALTKLLKARAKAILTPLAHRKADALGLPIARLTYRDTLTRWGSCSSSGAISLNWRIMCAEPLLQDYLVAHEVAHLKEPHHQRSFWDQCARLMAQPQAMEEARVRLKAIGGKLMALPLS